MLLLNGSPLMIGGSPIIATAPAGFAPSNLALSPAAPSVPNNTASGSAIGTVSASGTTPITFTVSGGPFTMVGNSLQSTAILTGLATHNLTITATNAHGSADLNITVTVLAGAPVPTGTATFNDDVLMVGHSLVANAMPASLNYIHNEINVPGHIAHCWAPGRGIQANWDHSASFSPPAVDGRALLAQGGTEALVMTPVLPLSTNVFFGTEHEAATLWGNLAYANNNNVRIYLYETWPDRRTGTGSAPSEYDDWHLQDWRPRISNQLSEWEAFSTYYENNKTAGAPEMLIIPCGQAMAKLYDAIAANEVPGITDIDDFFDDEIHPNWLGFYFVEMVIWSCVYQRSPVGLPRYT
ncbi:MAG: cadherin repeat domain-containing protein, partial [Mycobacterium sp.]